MAFILLPLFTDSLHFDYEVDLEGVAYLMEFRWNDRDSAWYWSLYDGDGEPIVVGVKLVLDVDLLLRTSDVRKPAGKLHVVDTSDQSADPGKTDLGERVKLLYEESGTLG